MTLKYGIVSQSTAVFLQLVENVVNTRSCMRKINTVMYRDIHFWSYRPALISLNALCCKQKCSVFFNYDLGLHDIPVL